MADKLLLDQPKIREWLSNHWPDFDDYVSDMLDSINSERVMTIIGAAMLDLALRRLLAAFMVDDEKLADELLGKEGGGGDRPLSTFSARTKTCLALGLISAKQFKALDTVRQIRNAFAHKLSAKISEQTLDALVNNLCSMVDPYSESVKPESDRQRRLAFGLVNLTIPLIVRLAKIKHQVAMS